MQGLIEGNVTKSENPLMESSEQSAFMSIRSPQSHQKFLQFFMLGDTRVHDET
jgi:hypothetical protein